MSKIRICKERNCKNAATTAGFCRLHYLRNWKKLKEQEQERAAKKLNRYIEHMISRHPDRYVDAIKKDIRSPRFDKFIEEHFGFDAQDIEALFNEPSYDEDVRKLVSRLKSGA